MADHLGSLDVKQVEAWYRRLVALVAAQRISGEDPYASMLLRHYLDNRNPADVFNIPSRSYLRSYPDVVEALRYHRRVFLSEEPARVGTRTVLGISQAITKPGGIVPRLRGQGHRKLGVPGEAIMNYESLVQIGDGPLDILRIQRSGTAAERDLFTSLRGFQLHSQVLVRVTAEQGGGVRVTFANWRTHVHDRYDWNYGEHLTMPNPDFGSTAKTAVRPGDQSLVVYHSNAKRLEDAKLAAPYDVRSAPWVVNDPALVAPAVVRP